MADLTWYKGLQVLDDDNPPGAGGKAIHNDLKKLVDWQPKSMWAETTDPGSGNNTSEDFYPGSCWLNTSASPPKLFVCQSSTDSSAVWMQVLIEVVQDTSPQLGGNLDVNGKSITTASNGSIVLDPNGSGLVFIGPTKNTLARGLPLNIETNVPGFTFYDNNASDDFKAWDFFANGDKLFFRLLKDSVTASGWKAWLEVTRSVSGTPPNTITVVDQIKLIGLTRIDGTLYHNQTYCDNSTVDDADTITFNLATSDMHTVILGTADGFTNPRQLALSNVHIGQRFNVTISQSTTGSGSQTVTWWSGISWPSNTAPTLTTTAGKKDVFEFLCTHITPSPKFIGRVWGQNYNN